MIHGHRGARGLAPENTLEGFERALGIGVDVLEMDVALTADDVVVVTHDPQLNPDVTRDADGRWLERPGPAIRELTVAELRRYDVGRIRPGTAYARRFPEQVPQDGARIPTLAEVFALDPAVPLNIELKSSPDRLPAGPVLAEAVAACADPGRTIVQSFDWRGLRHLQRRHPDLTLSWLTESRTDRSWWDFAGAVPESAPAAVAAAGGATWAPAYEDLTEALLDEASSLGLLVVPWTVNRPDDMARLIGWGVDGLITDRPDLARVVLAEAGGVSC